MPLPYYTPNTLRDTLLDYASKRGIPEAFLYQMMIDAMNKTPASDDYPWNYPMPRLGLPPGEKMIRPPAAPPFGVHPFNILDKGDRIPGFPPTVFPEPLPEAKAPNLNQALLAGLSPKQREAYALQAKGLNQSQIGRELGISQVAARKRLLNAQRNLPQPTEEEEGQGA